MKNKKWSIDIAGEIIIFVVFGVIFAVTLIAMAWADKSRAQIGIECVKAGSSWDGNKCESKSK